MAEVIQLIAIGGVLVWISAMIAARTSSRKLGWAIALWLFAPAIPMAAVLAIGTVLSAGPGGALYNASFAIMLIGAIILVPWFVLCGIGFAIGFARRRKRAPEAQSAPRQAPPTAAPQAHIAASAAKPHFSHSAPDGSIRIDIEPVEWASGQFVNTPRVIETANNRILCDLLGTDWEAHTAFPRERYIWLGLRRFRSPGHLFAEFDLDADRYRIALQSLETPDEEGLIGDITDRLEHWWPQATTLAASRGTKEQPAPSPGPFAAWRTALILLVGALAAIAGLTYLSVNYGIDPPRLPTGIPHIPHMPH